MNNEFSQPKDFLGYPKGLYILFLSEMWERFSFYGMRVLLVFYLTQHFLFDDKEAILIFGSYSALVNASPLIGGLLADRFLGFRKAIILGAILMLLGHLGMAYEGSAAKMLLDGTGNSIVQRDTVVIAILYFSLALLIVGVGFLKPNISTLVGSLFQRSDPRRDSAYTIFQMGVNVGAMIGAMICGYLGQTYGWNYGFGSAAVGMLIGLIVFIAGKNTLQGQGMPPDTSMLRTRVIGVFNYEHLNYIGSFILIFIIYWILRTPEIIGSIISILAVLCALWFVWLILVKLNKTQKKNLIALAILLFFFLGYVILIEQIGTSFNLFMDRNVDRTFAGISLHASQVYAILPGMVIIFSPIFAWLWIKLEKKNLNPSVAIKFVLGLVIIGFAYFVVVYAASFANNDNQLSLYWIIIYFVLFAISDILMVPIAISSVVRLAPKQNVGLMMGVYFFTISAASYLAALAANTAAIPESHLGKIDTAVSLTMYTQLFTNLVIFAVVMAVILLMLVPFMRKLMH